MESQRGRFITLEGIEGCGKSTQSERLAAFLSERGIPCFHTKQPGGTAIGRRIRQILLHTQHGEMTPYCEALLYLADRAQHHAEVIGPTLARGEWVVCDRYQDSTRAYQAAARGVDRAVLESIFQAITGNCRPDLTLLLDLDVGEGLRRANARNKDEDLAITEGRFEEEDGHFHEAVRRAFLDLAAAEPDRFVVIPAQGTPDLVAEAVRATIEQRWATTRV